MALSRIDQVDLERQSSLKDTLTSQSSAAQPSGTESSRVRVDAPASEAVVSDPSSGSKGNAYGASAGAGKSMSSNAATSGGTNYPGSVPSPTPQPNVSVASSGESTPSVLSVQPSNSAGLGGPGGSAGGAVALAGSQMLPSPARGTAKGFYDRGQSVALSKQFGDLSRTTNTKSRGLNRPGTPATGYAIGGGGLGGGLGGMPGGSGGGGGLGPGVDSFGLETQSLADMDLGRGPGMGGDQYDQIVENEFLSPWDSPYSTFSIDVDTAAYSKVRMYLMQHNQLPRPDAVRIEELINYFPYNYEPPASDESAPPFAARMTVSECPWNAEHRLVRVGIKGKEIAHEQRPASNLVFLLDVSGSMNQANKLPLLVEGMKMLTNQLGENDTVSIVVYAGAAGMVLEPTNGDDKEAILQALTRLRAGGSTNGGAGIKLAYQTAISNFIKGGVNRVILCTDGDFNVGVTGNDELIKLAETNAKEGVFLTVLGFGMGNHNDSMLEQISNKGNGNYSFIDTHSEARKVLVDQMSSTLITIAKDVKIQVEFNPERVASYRLIGYENRILAAEDFNDDTKDAGEIGAGHSVTAIYEIVPSDAEEKPELAEVDSLKYQRPPKLTKEAKSDELLTVKIRYKKPEADKSVKLEFPLNNKVLKFGETDIDFRFTAAVASFGMLLRQSQFRGDASYDAVIEIASEAAQDDEVGYRTEFIEMVKRAKELTGN